MIANCSELAIINDKIYKNQEVWKIFCTIC
jgi:hypothetical protein